jgi:hypothetical protein
VSGEKYVFFEEMDVPGDIIQKVYGHKKADEHLENKTVLKDQPNISILEIGANGTNLEHPHLYQEGESVQCISVSQNEF